MSQPVVRLLVTELAALILVLLIPAFVVAQDIPPIPHPLAGRDDCLTCHATGIAGATQNPGDHAGRTEDTCQGCHQPVTEPMPAAESPPSASILHPSDERDECLTCHVTEAAGFPQVPGDHVGRTDDICRSCHQLSTDGVHGEPPTYPSIPHPLEGHDDCRACHTVGARAPQPPDDHTNWPGETCLGCHQPEAPPSVRENCLDCHRVPEAAIAVEGSAVPEGEPPAEGVPPAAEEAAPIPHPLVRRDDCWGCHQAGVGGAPLMSSTHSVWAKAICRDCHQPATDATTEPIPTAIASYPWPERDDSCRDCHSMLEGQHADAVTQWERGIHAQRQVSCHHCHGGDPAADTAEAAKSPKADYTGVPARVDSPALCASCHADVALMRKYDLSTDQWAGYQGSIHGYQLSKGDANPATCFDCHGGHQILKVDDPASSVYPSNVVDTCASCHASKAWMAAYNLPIDQFDLYRQSAHGQALFDKGDFRAPTCATCHGSHSAGPPDLEEDASICGSCHSTTQGYYIKSPHARAGRSAPQCITCHGPHDASKPSEALFGSTRPRHCGACHSPGSEPDQIAETLSAQITAAAQIYEEAVATVQSAQRVGVVTAPLMERLSEANTHLATLRAAQHTLDTDIVHKQAEDVWTVADEVKTKAENAIADMVRYGVMIVALAIGGLTILLYHIFRRRRGRQQNANSQTT